jgi:glycosyltransferase involved in cell wall biosynthesis
MLRVFHVPSHLSYVGKLASDHFSPVSPPFGVPLRVGDLLALASWDFFDVLHLHTVELASLVELTLLTKRLRRLGKGLVFTVHDLAPNLETDHNLFEEKTQLVISAESAIVTLTYAAATYIETRFGCKASVIPHGFAVSPTVATPSDLTVDHLLVLGALRPNRDLVGVARAWRLLPKDRPPLHLLLRSVSSLDIQRYAADLAELHQIARSEPGLIIEMSDHMLSPDELVERSRSAMLVLPYRAITHSGQLELARDLGVPVLAPDVPTVHAQLDETNFGAHPCIWFSLDALHDNNEFVTYLEKAVALSSLSAANGGAFIHYRTEEHKQVIHLYGSQYSPNVRQR